nr:MAG TPA: hypothetical protein [Caudoviricetes sp.]
MFATSLWVNQEKIGSNINLTIGERGIYVNGGVIEKGFNICIFAQIKELKEIEHIGLAYVEINNIIVRDCRYFVIEDGFINFMNKEHNLVAYIRLYSVKELAVRTTDGVMYIADKN